MFKTEKDPVQEKHSASSEDDDVVFQHTVTYEEDCDERRDEETRVVKSEENKGVICEYKEDLREIPWIECVVEPQKFEGGKLTSKKYVYGEYEYNHHETNQTHSIYRCRMRRQGCKAELKRNLLTNKWYYKLGHQHPTPADISKAKVNVPRITDLLPSRQEELREAVQKFTRTRAATDIFAVLNQGINASDPKLFIYPQQVRKARELWVYTQDVKTFEQVCLRKDLSHNKRDQPYPF
jgi:hypothetical protein